MPKFDKASYLSYLEISTKPRLLVEGYTDKTSLRYAIDYYKDDVDEIEIDTAEDLIQFESVLGNREKVEEICKDVVKKDLQKIFLGLVDREHRKFKISEKITSLLKRHNKEENLYWTFGHSIENYVFRIDIVVKALKMLANSPNTIKALKHFEELFDSSIHISSALSIVIDQLDLSRKRVTSFIEWNSFNIYEKKITLDLKKFKEGLISRGFNEKKSEDITKMFSESLSISENSNIDVARTYCHGHIGLKIIKKSFACCLNEYLDDTESIYNCFLGYSDDKFFHVLINTFFDLNDFDANEFPSIILSEFIDK